MLAFCSIEGKSNTRQNNPQLHLMAKVNQASYYLNEEIQLEAVLKNISLNPIAIFKKFSWAASGSFDYSIHDPAGNLLISKYSAPEKG
jgi:hypothetical protein